MKKTYLYILTLIMALVLCTVANAKTHTAELIAVDRIEYTLEEEDKLSIDLLIDEDGLYTAKITNLYSSGTYDAKLSVTIYDGKDEIYFYETGRRSQFETEEEYRNGHTFMLGLTEGEYRMVIENKTLFEDVSFVFESTFTEEILTEGKGGSSFSSATEMEFREKYHGGVSVFGETDYYMFDMPYDGYVFIEMYSPSLKYFSLYNSEENEIGYVGIKIDESDKVYSLRTGLPKGRYYIGITPYEDYTAPYYTVKAIAYEGENFETEYNNTKTDATPIVFGKEYQGNMFGFDDKDVYAFTLHDDSEVEIRFTDSVVSGKHYIVKLLSEKEEIFSYEDANRRTLKESLSKGTYYLTVENYNYNTFSSAAYKIEVTAKNHAATVPEEKEETVEEKVPEKTENEAVNEATPEEAAPVIPFDDVAQNKWYYGELLEAKTLGLIEGVGDNKYNPDGNVSIAEVITMAVRIKNKIGGTNTEITPSPVGKWYNSYITFAVNSGIITVSDFDDFDRNATRKEVAYIFSNIFGENEENNGIFIPDVNENTKYHDSIYKLYNHGILKGGDDGAFRPDDNVSRAETAAILLRVHKSI